MTEQQDSHQQVPAQGSSRRTFVDDLLTDPEIAQTINEDPLFQFLFRHWRQLLMAVAAVALAYYAYGVFEQTRMADLQRTADIYRNVRTEFAALHDRREELARVRAKPPATTEAPDKLEEYEKKIKSLEPQLLESQQRLESYLTALGDSREPYATLATTYRAVLAVAQGDLERARGLLPIRWRDLPEDSKERFFAEQQSFILGRALLDREQSKREGWQVLTELASSTSDFKFSAALSLARIAATAEERKEVRTLLERLQTQYPEQRSLIEPILEGLSI